MKVHVMTVPGFSPERDAQVQWWRERSGESICVHADPKRHGVLWNHATIVDCMLNENTRWHLVVQDDAKPLDDWMSHIKIIEHFAPGLASFISLSHFGSYGMKLAQRGIPFGIGLNTIWGQAVLYRDEVLSSYRRLVKEVQELAVTEPYYRKWDDGLAAVHNSIHGTKSAFTSRALFEHQEWGSTLGHARYGRQAKSTIETLPMGPNWAQIPRARAGGPGMDAEQKALVDIILRKRAGL